MIRSLWLVLLLSVGCAQSHPTLPTPITIAASLNNHLEDGTGEVNCNAPSNVAVRYDGLTQVHVTNVSNCANDFTFALVDMKTGEAYGWDHERIEGSKKDAQGNEIIQYDPDHKRDMPIYTGKVISWGLKADIPPGAVCQVDGWAYETQVGNIREVDYYSGGEGFKCGGMKRVPTCQDIGTCTPPPCTVNCEPKKCEGPKWTDWVKPSRPANTNEWTCYRKVRYLIDCDGKVIDKQESESFCEQQ